MSANKRRLSDHPEAVLTCALLASAAPASPAAAAASPVIMNGGGSTLGSEVLAGSGGEFALFNAPTTDKAVFGTFWAAGGGTSQKAFIYDDLTCDSGAGACSGPDGGSGNTVDYAAPEDPLNASQISSWATSSFGQASAGNLIQIPAFGIAPAIVVNDDGLTENGQVELTDNDLCGIYSGLITDFSQITDVSPAPAPGQFQLVYRSDANGLTSLLTNHLSAVCNVSNTQAGVTFTATTTFASLFPGGINTYIPNAVGETGDAGVANYLSGLSGEVPYAVGYVSPGWTSLYPDAQTELSNGAHSALGVAALKNGKNFFQPTNANVAKGLLNPVSGYVENSAPPMNARRRCQSGWVDSRHGEGQNRLSDRRVYGIRGGSVLPECCRGQGRGFVPEGPLQQGGLPGGPERQWIRDAEAGHGQRIPHGHRGQYPCQRQFVEYEYPRPHGLRGLDGALKRLRISAGA